MYVGFDHVEGTKLLADWYSRSVPDLNRYALVYWAKGYVSEVRGDSFIDLMKQGKGPTLVSAYYTDASRQNAFENASRILQESTDLNLIYACFDALRKLTEIKLQKETEEKLGVVKGMAAPQDG